MQHLASPPSRRTPALAVALAGLAVIVVATIGVAGHPALPSPTTGLGHALVDTDTDVLGDADGLVPAGASVFDDDLPAVARLDGALLAALRRAATDADDDGVELQVNSGWRSPRYQEQLLQEAVAEYGSEAEAARWVGTPTTSAHVSGQAVDIGPVAATAWLSKHGARYGLCQTYRNEPWHYELRPDATKGGCPRMYADPTRDPRMRR